MALGDARQVGTEFKLSFGNLSYTGYLPEDGVSYGKNTANEEVVLDERNAALTKIFYNDGVQLDATFKIKSIGSITPPRKGDIIAITTPDGSSAENFMVVDADVTFNRGISMLKLSLIREDSMQSTYDEDVAPASPTFTLSDDGAQVLGIAVTAAWSSEAAQPDYVDVYLSLTDTQPSDPYITFKASASGVSGSQNFNAVRVYGSGNTVYGWAVARNSLSSTVATDSQVIS